MRSSSRFVGTAVAVVAALSIAGGVAASSTVVVRPGDVGTSWLASSRPGGSSSFVGGPATAPLGVGSLQFTTADVSASAQLFNFGYVGTPLASLDAMSYDAYRVSSSTNPKEQTIALALQVDVNGTDVTGGTATLIFEPDYQSGGNTAMKLDTWQTWDAFQGGAAIWWATRDLPNPAGPGFVACNPNGANAGTPACAGKLFIPLSSILTPFPGAVIAGGVGPFIGSGWDGQFSGNVDALRIGVSENTTTFDFEPKAALTVTATDATRVQGSANPTFAPTYAGFVHGDTAASLTTPPTCTTTATTASPVGTYPITCSGGASNNYDFTYVAGTLNVTSGATAAPTAVPTAAPTELVEAATGTPIHAATLPPTSAGGKSASGGDSTPLFAILICLAFGAFGAFGLLAVATQRRTIRH